MYQKKDTSKRISEIMLDVMAEDNLGKKMLEHRAADIWQVVLGPTVNNATKRVYVHEGVMHVELFSSVVRHELTMLKPRIIGEINKALGADVVRDIVFR